MAWLAGVDGCRGGWIAAFTDTQKPDHAPVVRVLSRFGDLFSGEILPDIVAVDMPIGLPDRVTGSGRGPERLVRPLLGERQSSVFAIPARAAVAALEIGRAHV